MARQTSPVLDSEAFVRAALEESARVKQAAAATLAEPIARAADWIAAAYRAGGKTLLFGNGGSASDAQHIAAEWTGKLGCVAAGLGVALVPALAMRSTPTDVALLRLHRDDEPIRRIFAATLSGRTPSAAVTRFLPHLTAAVDPAWSR